MIIKENFSIKNYNTFGIDVKAKYFVEASNENEAIEALRQPEFSSIPKFILGEGSNVLFIRDYVGVILRLVSSGIKILDENESSALVEAEAGETWDDLVNFCVNNNFYGIENLSLIPGTVGAAPVQNIGAYGAEFENVFDSLDGFFIVNGEKKSFNKDQCKFGYRDSIFKNELKEKFNLNYRAFQDYLSAEEKEKVTLQEVSALVKKIRLSKLPDPHKLGNAGSFFKNPEVKGKKLSELKKRFNDLVFFKIENDAYKIPAGWLIEKCGFKGKKIGNVGTYKNQALVIVNYGNANGEEVQKFAFKIQQAVFEKFGVEIIPEVNIL